LFRWIWWEKTQPRLGRIKGFEVCELRGHGKGLRFIISNVKSYEIHEFEKMRPENKLWRAVDQILWISPVGNYLDPSRMKIMLKQDS
jgi:hypothetical protein